MRWATGPQQTSVSQLVVVELRRVSEALIDGGPGLTVTASVSIGLAVGEHPTNNNKIWRVLILTQNLTDLMWCRFPTMISVTLMFVILTSSQASGTGAQVSRLYIKDINTTHP